MKAESHSILTVNGGSSSIKFALFEADGALRRVLDGRIEGIGLEASVFKMTSPNPKDNSSRAVSAPDHKAAVNILMDWIQDRFERGSLTAVGHRVVHGGPKYWEAQRITPEMIDSLRQLSPFDP
ncbi:MAG: acetate/propionate family kinase, partial [Limisphaerales bacterium]